MESKRIEKSEEKKDQPQVLKVEKKATIEELQKENEALRTQIANIPTDLESRIEYFKRQKHNLKKLSNINLLIDHLTEVQGKIYENISELDQSNYAVVIVSNNSTTYDRATLKISDINVVAGMSEYIMRLLEDKRILITEALCA